MEVLKDVVHGRVFIAQCVDLREQEDFEVVFFEEVAQYFPLCDDFGPMRLCEILRFHEMLIEVMDQFPSKKIAIKVKDNDKREFTNAVFLLGCFLMIEEGLTLEAIVQQFSWVDKTMAERFRDASFTRPSFGLSLADCWRALERGIEMGWIKKPSEAKPNWWGKYNLAEYEHYDNPLNGDLHVVVPGKFVAMRGPKDLHGPEYRDSPEGSREFSPEYYIPILHALNVTAVVRLNEPHYNASQFSKRGINHYELEFEDCTAPPDGVAEKFLHIAHNTSGLVAVHCKAGLGRTGTLIALYLMSVHKFSAREAIAWLRLIRPGCVIGEQQHYLVEVEETFLSNPSRASRGGRHPCVGIATSSQSTAKSTVASSRAVVTSPLDLAVPLGARHSLSMPDCARSRGRFVDDSCVRPARAERSMQILLSLQADGPSSGSQSAFNSASKVASQVSEGMQNRDSARVRAAGLAVQRPVELRA